MKHLICEKWILTIAVSVLLWLGITALIFIESLSYVRRLYGHREHASFINTGVSSGSLISEAVKITKILSVMVGTAEMLILIIIFSI